MMVSNFFILLGFLGRTLPWTARLDHWLWGERVMQMGNDDVSCVTEVTKGFKCMLTSTKHFYDLMYLLWFDNFKEFITRSAQDRKHQGMRGCSTLALQKAKIYFASQNLWNRVFMSQNHVLLYTLNGCIFYFNCRYFSGPTCRSCTRLWCICQYFVELGFRIKQMQKSPCHLLINMSF